MGELEKLATAVAAAIKARIEPPRFYPGKVSVWIKLVRPGEQHEETVGNVHKVLLTAGSYDDLVMQVAENMIMAVFGGDVQLFETMPNLIVKLLESKAYVPMAGAPPLDQAGQVFLKATVYKWEPSLWDKFFGNKERTGD